MLVHETVLLDEAVEALISDVDGTYVDGTFGRGGHSNLILQNLGADARLIGIDKDLRAIETAQELEAQDPRFSIEQGSFAQLAEFINKRDLVGKVDGILLDLGVSSPQLDDAERGFSFMNDGPLDMRMDTTRGESVAQWINRADMEDIAFAMKTFGEERHAKRIARAIVERREETPFTRTLDLAEVVKVANPSWERHKHPATRAFQGFRIHINSELSDLELCLDQALEMLRPGGRLVAISFHSLEDRIVKRFMRKQSKGDDYPMGVPVTEDMLNKRMRLLSKAVKASKEEVEANPRSRSAVMRTAEKIK